MQIAHIYPIANQELYQNEDFVMILAHLAQKGLYNPTHFSKGQFIIMDNGLFEGEQVSTSLAHCINIAEKWRLPVNEFIVPDAVNDSARTIELFENNLDTMYFHRHSFKFMFVAQAKSVGELKKMIQYANRYQGKLPLTIGISKLCKWNRAGIKAIEAYRESKFPIHFLGLKKSFSELEGLSTFNNIRSCDTSQLAYINKHHTVPPSLIIRYQRNEKKSKPIDLQNDICENGTLKLLKAMFEQEAYLNGLL